MVDVRHNAYKESTSLYLNRCLYLHGQVMVDVTTHWVLAFDQDGDLQLGDRYLSASVNIALERADMDLNRSAFGQLHTRKQRSRTRTYWCVHRFIFCLSWSWLRSTQA
jgi:hypothetical protein